MKRHQVVALFCCSLLSFLSVFGCSSGGGGGGGGSGGPPPPPPPTVTLQGRVDDGLQHSPIANATCTFSDLQGTPHATTTADSSGTFQLVVPLNVQGFLHCIPPSLSHLEMSTFISTMGRTAGEIIANLTVDPTTTLVAAVLANTNPPDPQARAAELIALLLAADPDLSLLAQASTALYTAQLATEIDVAFSSGSEEGGPGGGGSDGGGHGDGGGTAGETGDGGAFSPLPGASCDFALTMDGPVLHTVTLGDLLANGTVVRPDLQAIASPVNAALAGQQAAIIAAFNRLFPNGLGRPITATADANGSYFLSTPPGVPGFVRCAPADAAHLVLSRFVPARQTGEKLMGQTVTPATTVAAMVVTNALQAGLDPIPIQNAFLADIAPLQIILPDHPNGNGMFATVQLLPGTTPPNPNTALLAFAATAIFDTMRLQRANIPTTTKFTDALQDYFLDATFAPPLAPLAPAVNTALDQGQSTIGRGSQDVPLADSTGTIAGTVTDLNGTPLAGVQVVATQQGVTVQTVPLTDASGGFKLANVPPGVTTITATLGSVSTSKPLTVIAGGTVILTVTLGSPITGVTVTPHTALVGVGQTQQFTATVQGTGAFSSTAHWLVNMVSGGNATVGIITSTGLYTAPGILPSLNPVTITAVSDADPTQSDSAQVTVINVTSPPPVVTVTPLNGRVGVGQTLQFAATVQGTGAVSSAVTWAVNAVPGGNATVGTISVTGLYTAPSTVPSPNPVTITAVSNADSTVKGSAQVTIIGRFALTVSKTGSGSGTVTSTPAGISCGTDCTELYDIGSQVMLTAASATGSSFGGWSGGGCTGTGPCTATLTAATTVIATFNQQADLAFVRMTASPDPVPVGTPLMYNLVFINNGPGTATSITLTDTLPAGVIFVPASQGCSAVGGIVTCGFGNLGSGTQFGPTIEVIPTVSGTITNTAQAISTAPDPNPANNVGTKNTTVIPQSPRFAYVAHGDGTVSIYVVDATTGQLRHDGYSVDGTAPFSVTVDPFGRFVYVTDLSSNTISGYTVNASSGALTPIPGSPFATGTAPVPVTVDSFGRFVYVANERSNNISGYTITASTGALTSIPGSPFATGTTPQSVMVDPSGRFAYVANGGSNTISGYTINASSGVLTPIPGSPFPAGNDPFSVTSDPSGRFIYVANISSNNISGYTIDAKSGALTPTGPPVAAGTAPFSATVDPSGRFIYVANQNSNNISGYTIDASSGALTSIPGSPFPAGTTPTSVTVDSSGRFVYVTNGNSDDILEYTITATTGALTTVGAIRTRGLPNAIALTRGTAPVTITPRFAYVANNGSNNVSGYTIDASNGVLTPIPGSPFPAGTAPESVIVDPFERFAYVANNRSNNISGYTISAATGALTPIARSPFPAGGPLSVTVDPSGRFAYIANQGYTIDASNGVLTPIPGSPFPAGTLPLAAAVDPSGRFAYVANSGSNDISAFMINASSGALTAVPGSPFPAGTQPDAVTVDPSGRFVYVANSSSNNISAFTINASSGALTPVPGSPFPAGTSPEAVAVTPSGRFVYVANPGSSNNVSGYTIDTSSGALTPIPGSPFPAGAGANSVTVDPSSRFVYVGNGVSNNISGYTITATTGALVPIPGSPFLAGAAPSGVITTGTIQ